MTTKQPVWWILACVGLVSQWWIVFQLEGSLKMFMVVYACLSTVLIMSIVVAWVAEWKSRKKKINGA